MQKKADNAFEGCLKLTTPKWLHYIPAKDGDWLPLVVTAPLHCEAQAPVASTGTGYNTAMHSDMESQMSSLVSNERQLAVSCSQRLSQEKNTKSSLTSKNLIEEAPALVANSPLLDKTLGSFCAVQCGTPSESAITSRLSSASAVSVQSTEARCERK